MDVRLLVCTKAFVNYQQIFFDSKLNEIILHKQNNEMQSVKSLHPILLRPNLYDFSFSFYVQTDFLSIFSIFSLSRFVYTFSFYFRFHSTFYFLISHSILSLTFSLHFFALISLPTFSYFYFLAPFSLYILSNSTFTLHFLTRKGYQVLRHYGLNLLFRLESNIKIKGQFLTLIE